MARLLERRKCQIVHHLKNTTLPNIQVIESFHLNSLITFPEIGWQAFLLSGDEPNSTFCKIGAHFPIEKCFINFGAFSRSTGFGIWEVCFGLKRISVQSVLAKIQILFCLPFFAILFPLPPHFVLFGEQATRMDIQMLRQD